MAPGEVMQRRDESMVAPAEPRYLALTLLLLRLGVAIVMIAWTADKFVNQDHARAVFSAFYGLSGITGTALLWVGVAQGILVLAFAAGAFKTITYGAVLLMHAVSTFSSWRQYLDPFDNLLFFAAWPMLATCIGLFLLRDRDRLLVLDGFAARTGKRRPSTP